jgi:hypothetical protein
MFLRCSHAGAADRAETDGRGFAWESGGIIALACAGRNQEVTGEQIVSSVTSVDHTEVTSTPRVKAVLLTFIK